MEEHQRRMLESITWKIWDALSPIKRNSHGIADAIHQADHNGLLYIAERITPKMKVLYWNPLETDNSKIGSPEFFETSLADAYVLDTCGCDLAHHKDLASAILHKVPLKLLEHGRVFQFITASDCGKEFDNPHFLRPDKEYSNRVDSLLTKPMSKRVEDLALIVRGKLGISELMESRLALMPYLFLRA